MSAMAAFCRAAARIGRFSSDGTVSTNGLHRSFSKLPDYLAGAPPVTDADIEELNQEVNEFFGDSSNFEQHGMDTAGETLFPAAADAVTERTAAGKQDSTMNPGSLTHVDREGRASMVDVADKKGTVRAATASGLVVLGPEAFKLVRANEVKKGDVLSVAQLAGIMGAKATSQLIPLCHNIFISSVDVRLSLDEEQQAVRISSTAKTVGTTGVEMEALTATSVAALTVYDMCKAVSKDIVIQDIMLDAKSGGKSKDYERSRE